MHQRCTFVHSPSSSPFWSAVESYPTRAQMPRWMETCSMLLGGMLDAQGKLKFPNLHCGCDRGSSVKRADEGKAMESRAGWATVVRGHRCFTHCALLAVRTYGVRGQVCLCRKSQWSMLVAACIEDERHRMPPLPLIHLTPLFLVIAGALSAPSIRACYAVLCSCCLGQQMAAVTTDGGAAVREAAALWTLRTARVVHGLTCVAGDACLVECRRAQCCWLDSHLDCARRLFVWCNRAPSFLPTVLLSLVSS
jgi:hypothetical protein